MPQRVMLAIAALFSGFVSLACEDVSVREDRRALMAHDRDIAQRVATEGFRVMEEFYDEDAVYMPSFNPTIEGRDKILEVYRPYYDDKTMKLTWTPARAEVSRSRDLGWTIGTYEFSYVNKKGEPVVRRGRYVTIWEKQADGGWKAVLDSGSPDEHHPDAAVEQSDTTGQAPAPGATAAPQTAKPVAPGGSRP